VNNIGAILTQETLSDASVIAENDARNKRDNEAKAKISVEFAAKKEKELKEIALREQLEKEKLDELRRTEGKTPLGVASTPRNSDRKAEEKPSTPAPIPTATAAAADGKVEAKADEKSTVTTTPAATSATATTTPIVAPTPTTPAPTTLIAGGSDVKEVKETKQEKEVKVSSSSVSSSSSTAGNDDRSHGLQVHYTPGLTADKWVELLQRDEFYELVDGIRGAMPPSKRELIARYVIHYCFSYLTTHQSCFVWISSHLFHLSST
jgi:hypothetical protein